MGTTISTSYDGIYSRLRTNTFNQRLIGSTALIFVDNISILFIYEIISRFLSPASTVNLADFIFLALSGFTLVVFFARGHYYKRTPFWSELGDLCKVLFFIALLQGALSTLVQMEASAVPYMTGWIFGIVIFISMRMLMKGLLLRINVWQLPTVIIGDGPNAVETAHALQDDKLLGYDIIAFLSPEDQPPHRHSCINIGNKSIPIKRLGTAPEKFLRRLGSPYVVVALEKGGLNQIQHYFDKLSLWYSKISVVPALKGLPLFGTDTTHFFSHEILMLNTKNNISNFASLFIKRCFDIICASLLLILLMPLMLVIAHCVRKSGKQIIFSHKRVGKNGNMFKCYKFRSMVPNAEEVLKDLLIKCKKSREEWNQDFKLKNDPRITKIGRILRKTSLDELPQLWNVIKGDMSLVGPRPIIRDELKHYGEKSAFYYRAKPGITGLWQVSGRNDIDYETRVDLDVWYVRNWSFWNDLVILLRTVKVVLSKSGAY